jgi:hypothetical protein
MSEQPKPTRKPKYSIFSYEFWILMGFFVVGNLIHSVYKWQTNVSPDPAVNDDLCWMVIVQAICMVLCLFSAECEKRLEFKRKG